MFWWPSFSTPQSKTSEMGVEFCDGISGLPPPSPTSSPHRRRSSIRSDDPDFVELVAALRARLEDQDNPVTLQELAMQAGLSQNERDLLFAVSRDQNAVLYRLQQEHRQFYTKRRLQMAPSDGGFCLPAATPLNRTHVEAMTLAMSYFGVPVPPLEVRDDFNSTDNTNGADISPMPWGDSDAFSDSDITETGEDQDHAEPVTLTIPARTAPRLLGGAEVVKRMKTVRVGSFGKTFSVRTTRAFLYGYQGAVRFDLADPMTFVDAVFRLMGATQKISISLLKGYVGGYHAAVVQETYHGLSQHGPDEGSGPFAFDKIRLSILESRHGRREIPDKREDDDGLLVPFVHAPDQQLADLWHWRPSPYLVKCIVNGSALSGRREDSGDAAYLPIHIEYREKIRIGSPNVYTARYRLGSNQYGRWMQVAARILTPGAGHALASGTPGSIVAHSRMGLHDGGWRSGPAAPFVPFTTYGGLGFTSAHFQQVADSLAGNLFKSTYDGMDRHSRYATFDMEPLPRWTVCVFLPGLSSDASEAVGPEVTDSEPISGIQEHFHTTLARCIDRVLTAGTTAEERRLLKDVNVWSGGAIWDPAAWFVTVPALPTSGSSLELTTTGYRDPPSIVSIQPNYSTYTAHVERPGDKTASFAFEIDGPYETFFNGVKAILGAIHDDANDPDYEEYKEYQDKRFCTSVESKRDLNHIWIRQRDGSNRPEFLLSAKTTENEWQAVCNQIVGPEVWVTREKEADWHEADIYRKGIWGYQDSYKNLESMPYSYGPPRRSLFASISSTPTTVDGTDPETDLASLNICSSCLHKFAFHDTIEDKLRHMVEQHSILKKEQGVSQLGAEAEVPTDRNRPLRSRSRTPSKVDANDDSVFSGASAGKKRKRATAPKVADPSYKPPKGEEEDDAEEGEEGKEEEEEVGRRKKATPKKKAGDPSYHPGKKESAAGDEDDDDDDQLRQSAVPEYDRDPTDPTGKQLRVIREARGRAAKAVRLRQDKSAAPVAVTIAKASLKAKAKAKGKGKAAEAVKTAGSAASTLRRGRSRNTTPALEA
ncbi:hypothetical protein SPBR_01275 [Sporothrix brasiliensis 5110]|uniref:Uncharacterized protein n=1 Tax=Sporothrix brasiliensis 5110 TaxID=1398154 RepID=A0A0C2EWW8_9PEZI|nr:uncharacterized protein SPBR_01275 [Sporothrix brasiliensis 5110]KIH91069.1 hypothetical protein SPBR_01275 [Sporothrix brasiliensis 5110]